jgi:protein-tyrosine phosphatase
MTEFSKTVLSCIAEWSKRSADCNGNTECLEQSARQLRKCLDAAFPDSKKVELESDKVNYMLSSVFFLANRLSKATEGLAEFDKVMNSIEKIGKASLEEKENQQLHTKFQKELDDILGKYF